jgi:hypothetical protein
MSKSPQAPFQQQLFADSNVFIEVLLIPQSAAYVHLQIRVPFRCACLSQPICRLDDFFGCDSSGLDCFLSFPRSLRKDLVLRQQHNAIANHHFYKRLYVPWPFGDCLHDSVTKPVPG